MKALVLKECPSEANALFWKEYPSEVKELVLQEMLQMVAKPRALIAVECRSPEGVVLETMQPHRLEANSQAPAAFGADRNLNHCANFPSTAQTVLVVSPHLNCLPMR